MRTSLLISCFFSSTYYFFRVHSSRFMSDARVPTRFGALVFRGKATLLQARRAAENLLDPGLKRFPRVKDASEFPTVAESRTALWTETAPEEQFLPAGKIHNL